MKLEDIDKVILHWSESEYINDILGNEDDGDLNKELSPEDADDLIRKAAEKVDYPFDKTVLSIILKNNVFHYNGPIEYYLQGNTNGLIDLIRQRNEM